MYVAGELFSQQMFEDAEAKNSTSNWTRILPVVREPGLFRTEAEVRLSSQATYALDLTPEGAAIRSSNSIRTRSATGRS